MQEPPPSMKQVSLIDSSLRLLLQQMYFNRFSHLTNRIVMSDSNTFAPYLHLKDTLFCRVIIAAQNLRMLAFLRLPMIHHRL